MLYLLKSQNATNQLPIFETAPNPDLTVNLNQLSHLKIKKQKKGYVVTLVDDFGYESLSGYGDSPIDAINDLHNCLI